MELTKSIINLINLMIMSKNLLSSAFCKARHKYLFNATGIMSLSLFLFIFPLHAKGINSQSIWDASAINQQNITITGVVTDRTGEVIPGVNIVIKGTTVGVITGTKGEYSIGVSSSDAVLVFSYLGYITQERVIGNQRKLDVILDEDVAQIDEVVVTALGIVKKEKSLTYSTQIVDGQELVRAKDPNMINSLAGKTAGVQINRSASGLGGSVKVVIRGDRSVSGSNQPLYVIDGVPINSSSNNQTATTIGGNNDSGNRDGGDGISNLNPDDIESMNILKGPAAAALYGSSAANGVVVITTKKGKTGRIDIIFNTNTTWENVSYGIPEFQNNYGGVTTSWGDKINGSSDYAKDFFNTGFTTINSLSLSSGSDAMQTYFSYANTSGSGIIEHNKLNKHNLNFRETANFFDKRLTLDANISLMYQNVENRPSPGGYYMNPLVGLYRFPRGGVQGKGNEGTFTYYKENYQYMNAERNMYLQNWYINPENGGWEQNPYWLINKAPSEDQRYRAIANLSLSFKINEQFTLQARGNADFITDNYEAKMYAGTDPALTGGTNGRYIVNESNSLSLYSDLMLTYQQKFGSVSVNATVGTSINDNRGKSLGIDSYPGGLFNPNLFTIRNVDLNGGSPSMNKYHAQEQAVFFAGQIGFYDWLFWDVTARNDWTSTLAFTKYLDRGFFYPSVGLTWVINESLKLPEWINLGKVRGAWSKVGNGLPRYRSNPQNSVGRGGVINYNSTSPFNELKPEMTTSVEAGIEWRFFGSRLEFDFTYYQTHTKNQLFSLAAPSGSKYTTYYVNAGDIQNQGVEIILGGSPVWVSDFRWKTSANFSLNRNKVIELAEGLGYFDFGGGGSNSYAMRLEVGGSFGDIYGRTFERNEQGNIQYDESNIPKKDSSGYHKIGNTSPKFNLGWQNTFTYKNFYLYFLIDGRFKGDVLSLTEADLDRYGVSKRTGVDRDNGGIMFDGKKISDVSRFYTIVGGRDGISEYYIYDATNIRMRELSIGYTIPRKLLDNVPVVKSIDLSLIGRNLFFFKNNAPYDPDGTLSVGNALQGVDSFGMPSTRSFGFNIKANF
ncbi:TonB-dependent receptor SusC [termite gut metagenome]|uniref:TonB-dependent receptor SusC n=1 Tax=termite gut metagenome TaxID=433724 RepID=A0A5J4R7T7_9ZZZZ